MTTFIVRMHSANASGVSGLFNTPRGLTIGPEVVLQNPVLASPTNNSVATGAAILAVGNVQRTGPAVLPPAPFEVPTTLT